MKQKKFFNLKLYLEGIRQIRTLGILALVVQLIIGILIPVGNYLSEKSYYEEQLKHSKTVLEITITSIDVETSHIYMFLIPIYAFLMVLMLFKFLNNREDCDFYHSIPHTRPCLFNSYGLAIISWIVAIVFIMNSVSCICYKLFDKFLEISYGNVWGFGLNIMVLSILISCVAMLACAMCGNVMTTLVVFFILLLMPKIVMLVYFALLESALPFLSQDILGIFSPKYHLLFGMIQNLDYYYRDLSYAAPNSATLYTLIIAIVNYIVANLAFTKRTSESAGNAMSSDKLQTGFRTLFTSLICLIPIAVMFELYLYNKMEDEISDKTMITFSIVVTYIVALVFMYIYELVTTKSAKKALRAFRSIPVVVGINVLAFLILIFSYNYHGKVRIDAKDIDAVTFSFSENYGDFYGAMEDNYFSSQLSSYKFTDDAIIQLLCDSYNHYAEDVFTPDIKDEKDKITSQSEQEFYEHYYSEMHKVEFFGDKDYVFYINFTSKTLNELYKYFEEIPEIKEVYMNLPSIDNKDHLYHYENYEFTSSLSDKDLINIYNVLREELKSGTVDYMTWYNTFNYLTEDYTPMITLELDVYEHDRYYYLSLPITSATPKTLEYVWNLTLDNAKNNFNDFENTMKLFDDNYDAKEEDTFVHMSFTAVSRENNGFEPVAYIDYFNDEYNKTNTTHENIQQLASYAKPLDEYDKATDIYLFVNFNYTSYNTYNEIYKEHIICIPKSVIEEHYSNFWIY